MAYCIQLFGEEKPFDPEADMAVRAGIVGAGDGGMLNYYGLRAAGAEVVALCDNNEDQLRIRAKELAADGGVKFYTDFQQMLARLDIALVVIATPDHLHFNPVIASLEAGKSVFVEKPLSVFYPGREIFSLHVSGDACGNPASYAGRKSPAYGAPRHQCCRGVRFGV